MKTNKARILALIVGGIALSLAFTGCENPANEDGLSPTLRYETVPYTGSGAGRAAGDSKPYELVYSAKDASNYYYLYYMGYVRNAPVLYKTAYRYDGTTPITFTWEKTDSVESTVTESMAKAKEETWEVNASVTAGVTTSISGGIKGIVEASVQTNISATLGGSYGETVSTSSTVETAQAKVSGSSESISATVGGNNEPQGAYRYALFGITDSYCLFTVDPNSRNIKKAEVFNSARASSLAWGIDFDPDYDSGFGKTGAGDKFEIPDVDFSTVPIPTLVVNEEPDPTPPPPPPPPPPEPQTIEIYTKNFQDILMGTKKWDVLKGNAHVDSGGTKWIEYEVRANFSVNSTRKSIHVKIFTIVREIYGDYTEIQLTREFDVASQNSETIESLAGQTAQTPNAGDYVVLFGGPGVHFDGNLAGVAKQLSAGISLGNNDTLYKTYIRLDGPGTDNDADGVNIWGDIKLQYKAYR
jgi:hypothetical protein